MEDIYIENLKKIGTHLSDYEEVGNNKAKYTIIGKGNFAYVEKMKSKLDNKIYAIKKINFNSQNFNKKDFKRETKLMINLNHENIIKFYGYFKDIEKVNKYKEIYKDSQNKEIINNLNRDINVYCLVLEFAPNGSLLDLYSDAVYNNPNKQPRQEFMIKVFKQLLNGLKYLHVDKHIIHRDIKLDNILLDEKYNMKISDFGISAYYDKSQIDNDEDSDLKMTNTRVGREDFISPEIEKGENYNYDADIFGVGLIMLILMSKEYPIALELNLFTKETKRIIKNNLIYKDYNDYLKNLVLKMIEEKKEDRPNVEECMVELELIEKYINAIEFLNKEKNIKENDLNNLNNNTIKNNENNNKEKKNNEIKNNENNKNGKNNNEKKNNEIKNSENNKNGKNNNEKKNNEIKNSENNKNGNNNNENKNFANNKMEMNNENKYNEINNNENTKNDKIINMPSLFTPFPPNMFNWNMPNINNWNNWNIMNNNFNNNYYNRMGGFTDYMNYNNMYMYNNNMINKINNNNMMNPMFSRKNIKLNKMNDDENNDLTLEKEETITFTENNCTGDESPVNIVFYATTGLKVVIVTSPNITLAALPKIYINKLGLSEDYIGKLIFLFNGKKIDLNSKKKLKEFSILKEIVVYNVEEILGAKKIEN